MTAGRPGGASPIGMESGCFTMKIGIYGGTFDPPHLGHMEAARTAMEQLGLERIVLRTNPDNAKAIHVYEKCGFREYARTAEHVCMELSR